MRLTLAGLLVLAATLFVGYFACPYMFAPSELLVINAGDKHLVSGHIRVSDSSSEEVIPRLAPGDTAKFAFRITREAEYWIDCRWEDGRALRDTFGYVTVGLVLSDTVSVTPSGVN